MISFNNLGHMGRLGNQMFQYSALKGIAIKRQYQYSIPSNTSLQECFKLPTTSLNQNTNSLSIDQFEFDSNLFNNCPDDVDLIGYFQTEKYFKHIESEIRQDFIFRDRIINICSHYIENIFKDTDLICLHIRRTDYLTDKNFFVLGLNYYMEALSNLPDLPVLVLSDDPEWCKKYFTTERFKISKSYNPNIDLCLMSLCDYHIIANSSFSWWGSWLAKSKKTIAPKNWFAEDFANWNTKDLYLPNWIIL